MKKIALLLIALTPAVFLNAYAAGNETMFCPSTHIGQKLFEVSGEQPNPGSTSTNRFLICSYGKKSQNLNITFLNAAPVKMDYWKITPQPGTGLSFATCKPVNGNTYNCPFFEEVQK